MTQSTLMELLPGDEVYAPRIEVVIDDQRLSDNILLDVIELKVTLQRDELGGFTMQLANHFEVPEVQDSASPASSPLRRFRNSDDRRFDVFKPISIKMGYADRLVTLFVGEIMMLQPAFPSSGMPTFSVTGTDLLQRLRRSKASGDTRRAFPGLPDWQIAKLIAERHQLAFSRRSNMTGTSTGETVMQRDMDDLQFVLYLAKRNDYECAMILSEQGTPELYFGTSTDKRDGTPVTSIGLTYGESLISFTPRLRVASQVARVTVRGWDARTKQKFEYTATAKDLPPTGGTGTTGPELVEKQVGAKEERIVDRPVQSQAEARTLAIQLLTEIANQFLGGSGEAIGSPDIVPGVNLALSGLGQRYDGDYYVTRTDHVFGASGYTTSFEVERLRETKS